MTTDFEVGVPSHFTYDGIIYAHLTLHGVVSPDFALGLAEAPYSGVVNVVSYNAAGSVVDVETRPNGAATNISYVVNETLVGENLSRVRITHVIPIESRANGYYRFVISWPVEWFNEPFVAYSVAGLQFRPTASVLPPCPPLPSESYPVTITPFPTVTPDGGTATATPDISPTPTADGPTSTPWPTQPPGTAVPTRTPTAMFYEAATIPPRPTGTPILVPTLAGISVPGVSMPSIDGSTPRPAAPSFDLSGFAPQLPEQGGGEEVLPTGIITGFYTANQYAEVIAETWLSPVTTGTNAIIYGQGGIGGVVATGQQTVEMVEEAGTIFSLLKAIRWYAPNIWPLVLTLIIAVGILVAQRVIKFSVAIVATSIEIMRRVWQALPFT